MGVTTLFCLVFDAIPQYLTVFDIFRNQYFYLGEPIIEVVPSAALTLMNMLLINEMADDDNAGTVSGLMSTITMLGLPLAQVLGNQIFAFFKPDLSDPKNFLEDKPDFRRVVAWSLVLTYAITLAGLALLPLLPNQKEEARMRKYNWPHNNKYATVSITILSLAFFYTLLVDAISMNSQWECLR